MSVAWHFFGLVCCCDEHVLAHWLQSGAEVHAMRRLTAINMHQHEQRADKRIGCAAPVSCCHSRCRERRDTQ